MKHIAAFVTMVKKALAHYIVTWHVDGDDSALLTWCLQQLLTKAEIHFKMLSSKSTFLHVDEFCCPQVLL